MASDVRKVPNNQTAANPEEGQDLRPNAQQSRLQFT